MTKYMVAVTDRISSDTSYEVRFPVLFHRSM